VNPASTSRRAAAVGSLAQNSAALSQELAPSLYDPHENLPEALNASIRQSADKCDRPRSRVFSTGDAACTFARSP
jgi:hypothetical protein